MFKIADSFTNKKSQLSTDKRKRSQPNPDLGLALENRLWLLLYKLNLESLNVGGDCLIEYGKDQIITKKVDVIGESDDILLIAECTTQSNLSSKIRQWIGETSVIRQYSPQREQDYSKNVVYIFCTDAEVNENDKKQLNSGGIKLIDSSKLEYFEDLANQNKNIAYNQFVSFVCGKMQIRRFTQEELTVPATRYKYSNNTFCYLFGIQPNKLLPLATIPHRKNSEKVVSISTYQRMVKKNKIVSIQKFLDSSNTSFPSNIIVSFEEQPLFEPSGSNVNGIQHGLLKLKPRYQSISIIDGQHRLYAYDGHSKSDKHFIFVLAFEDMKPEEQIKTFIAINEKQTKVSPSLLWDLYSEILPEEDSKRRIADTVKMLNTDPKSILRSRIEYDSFSGKIETPSFTLESISRAFINFGLYNRIEGLCVSNGIESNKNNIHFKLVNDWFKALNRLAPDHWKREAKYNFILSNQGAGSLLKVLSELIKCLSSRDNIFTKDSLKNKDFTSAFESYLLPIVSSLEKVDPRTMTEFKGSSEGDKNRLFNDFGKILQRTFPELGFSISSSTEFEEEEKFIQRLLDELELNRESETLEVKESFFTDVKRFEATSQIEDNKDEVINKIIATIATFANSSGGHILVGVKDDGTVSGLDNTDLSRMDKDKLKNRINTILNQRTMNLIPIPSLRFYKYKQKTLLVIEVNKISDDALRLGSVVTVNGKFYVRKNDSTIEADPSEIGKYCAAYLSSRSEDSIPDNS